LDCGSGNSCKTFDDARAMVDAVAAIDSHRHEVIFKWQLESKPAAPNKPLDHAVFDKAYKYATDKGYPCTASVFDRESLVFLLQRQVPFVKIACKSRHNDCYPLIDLIPRGIRVYVSFDCKSTEVYSFPNSVHMACIPQYPARLEDYRPAWPAYSDHCPGLELWNYYHPPILEKHLCMEHTKDNPDSGVFALTPDELKEVIG
jgi:sialic acid synthase SpsE